LDPLFVIAAFFIEKDCIAIDTVLTFFVELVALRAQRQFIFELGFNFG